MQGLTMSDLTRWILLYHRHEQVKLSKFAPGCTGSWRLEGLSVHFENGNWSAIEGDTDGSEV